MPARPSITPRHYIEDGASSELTLTARAGILDSDQGIAIKVVTDGYAVLFQSDARPDQAGVAEVEVSLCVRGRHGRDPVDAGRPERPDMSRAGLDAEHGGMLVPPPVFG